MCSSDLEFNRIILQAKDFAGQYRVNPASVYLRLSGPTRALAKLEISSNQVYLNLKGLAVGEHSVPLNFSLPPEVRVVEQKPLRVKVRIIKSEP